MSDNPLPYVVATRENFPREVIERSAELPVVVDFWATWCQPCRVLGPVLERLAREFAGRLVLVKAETEAVPEMAEAFGVRSIPAVFGLRGGRVVDSFVGALPESAVRAWVENLLPTPAETLVAEARRLEPDDLKAAEARYRAAIDLDPNDPPARTGLARVLLRQGRPGEARPLIEAMEARGFLEPEAEAVKAELALHTRAEATGGVEASRAALAADPGNPALRLKLAEAMAASGGYDEALALGLELVEEHRKDVSPAAKQLMLDVFQLLPPDSELVAEYRRRLSAALW